MDGSHTLPVVTSDFVYFMLIGVKRLSGNQFGVIQIDREEAIKYCTKNVKEIRHNENRLDCINHGEHPLWMLYARKSANVLTECRSG